MNQVDLELSREAPDRRPEPEPTQPLHPRHPRQVAHVVHRDPLELLRPRRDAVGDDVHLVAALGEPPRPAQEDDRLRVADPQEAKRSVGHGAELYPGARPVLTPNAG